MAEVINSLQFDDIQFEDELRELIQERISEDDVYDIFDKEVNLIPFDDTVKKETQFPAITISVINPIPYSQTQEDIQIQPHTSFSVEVNVYTSGENRRRNNRKLSNIIIALLQSNGRLGEYYNRGLVLKECSELSYDVDNVSRWVIRMSGVCDNRLNLIYSI